VVELETGRIVGKHKGHWFHTIGQRKGMGLGGGPWFVIRKDIVQNIIYVSHGYDPQTAYCQHFRIRDFHALTLPLEQIIKVKVHCNATLSGRERSKFKVNIKIRHTPEFLPAQIEATDTEGEYWVHAAAPIHGVAPGQFCVIYDDCHHRCYGSGEIAL
jgi:tRNA-specific 2-thiouridylase